MKKPKQHTAILIFSRTAQEEAGIKQFGPHLSAAQNLQVAELLIRRTQRMAKRTRLPIFTVSGPKQRGRTFGQRFTNAIADIFAKGFNRVISIGTDCPALTSRALLGATRQLDKGKIVTGADHRGGLYFLGLCRHHFQQKTLSEISWQSGQDFEDIRRYAKQLGTELSVEVVLSDIDDAHDLQLIIPKMHTVCSVLKQLIQLLQLPLPVFGLSVWFRKIYFLTAHAQRGPPSCYLR